MINVNAIVNGGLNVAKKVGSGIATVAKSDAVKKLSLSAAVGAVGVLGSKGAEKLCVAGEKMAAKEKERKQERHLKQREKNIESWDGMSLEDLI